MKKIEFCIECREETAYRIQPALIKKNIRGKEYEFEILEAVCEKCGEAVDVPGLMESNARAVDRQYRDKEGIVSADDISGLMEVYNIGKAPLSLALGFGEITVTRYLQGQVPSKEYSDIMVKALNHPEYMIERLHINKDKIGMVAYKKALSAAEEIAVLLNFSEKLIAVVSYIFKMADEVSPLALQKLLYFVQGLHLAAYDKPLYEEDCRAWVHGPVYEQVYKMFKPFKFNPIDDSRFVLIKNRYKELNEDEKKIIELVLDTFGMYSGKVLEHITHMESPWIEARKNCLPGEYSNEVISKESIKNYFMEVAGKYEITTVRGIKNYINSKLGAV